MIRSLESPPSEVRSPVLESPVGSCADNIPSLVDSGEGQEGTATVSQSSDTDLAPVETESSSPVSGDEGERCSAVSDLVKSNIVEMSGRQMCRLCGMQVTLPRESSSSPLISFLSGPGLSTRATFPEETRRPALESRGYLTD